MSSTNVGKVLPKFFLAELEEIIAANISKSLRQDFATVKMAATEVALQVKRTLRQSKNGITVPIYHQLLIL